jgi:translation initiation factor 4E
MSDININNQSPNRVKESETYLLNLKENLKAFSESEAENKDFIYNQLSQGNDEYCELAYHSSNENEKKESTYFINNNLNSFHMLNCKWCFWYTSRKEKEDKIPYSERMKKIAEFSSLEEFFKYYMFLKSPSDMERNTDLSVFKNGYQPLWESCPESGIWFIRYKKSEDPLEIDLKWEKILFALIGK